MESLPPEIILDILSRLPITSLVQCKFVCRAWCNLACDPRLANMHFLRAAENDPCLIFHSETSDHPIQNQLCFADIDCHNSYQEKVKEFNYPLRSVMPEFDVVGSCNGFLCLSNSLPDNQHTIYIYNPFTREYKQLPQASLSQDQLAAFVLFQDPLVAFGFGFHPMSKEYKVVRIVQQKCILYCGRSHPRRLGYHELGFQIFTLGTHAWRDIRKAPYRLDLGASKAALVNGSLHWLTYPRRNEGVLYRSIVSFDLWGEQFQEVPQPRCGGLDRCNYHLVVLKGNLSASVYCENDELEIWVMKDYDESESWTKEFTIGGYVPVGLEQHVDPPVHYVIDRINRIKVQVVCILKSGEILLQFKGGVLVSYHPGREEFKDLKFHGLPKQFQTVIHIGSFISIDAANEIQR